MLHAAHPNRGAFFRLVNPFPTHRTSSPPNGRWGIDLHRAYAVAAPPLASPRSPSCLYTASHHLQNGAHTSRVVCIGSRLTFLLLILGRCTTIQDSICCKLCGKEYKNTIWLDRHEHKCKVASTAMTVIVPKAADASTEDSVEERAQMLLEPTNPMRDALARVRAAHAELEAAQAALSACVQRYEAATGPSRKAARRE